MTADQYPFVSLSPFELMSALEALTVGHPGLLTGHATRTSTPEEVDVPDRYHGAWEPLLVIERDAYGTTWRLAIMPEDAKHGFGSEDMITQWGYSAARLEWDQGGAPAKASYRLPVLHSLAAEVLADTIELRPDGTLRVDGTPVVTAPWDSQSNPLTVPVGPDFTEEQIEDAPPLALSALCDCLREPLLFISPKRLNLCCVLLGSSDTHPHCALGTDGHTMCCLSIPRDSPLVESLGEWNVYLPAPIVEGLISVEAQSTGPDEPRVQIKPKPSDPVRALIRAQARTDSRYTVVFDAECTACHRREDQPKGAGHLPLKTALACLATFGVDSDRASWEIEVEAEELMRVVALARATAPRSMSQVLVMFPQDDSLQVHSPDDRSWSDATWSRQIKGKVGGTLEARDRQPIGFNADLLDRAIGNFGEYAPVRLRFGPTPEDPLLIQTAAPEADEPEVMRVVMPVRV